MNGSCKTSLFSDAFVLAVVNFFREFYKLKLNALTPVFISHS